MCLNMNVAGFPCTYHHSRSLWFRAKRGEEKREEIEENKKCGRKERDNLEALSTEEGKEVKWVSLTMNHDLLVC